MMFVLIYRWYLLINLSQMPASLIHGNGTSEIIHLTAHRIHRINTVQRCITMSGWLLHPAMDVPIRYSIQSVFTLFLTRISEHPQHACMIACPLPTYPRSHGER